jgi:hypothetical protein
VIHLFAQSLNNSKAPVSPIGGWPKAIAIVAMLWTIMVALGWGFVTFVRAWETIRRHRGEDGWE